MKKIIFITILILMVSFCFAETKINLDEYFDNTEYCTEKYKLDFSDIYYSYQNVEGSNRFVKKAIFYIYNNKEPFLLLSFDSKSICNSTEKMMDCFIHGHEFYGWIIRFYRDDGYISADFYTNNGKNVADTLSFKLNKNSMKYEWSRIDPLEY